MSMVILPSAKVYIATSLIPQAGRGVFAAKNLTENEIIEICPVIPLPNQDEPYLEKTRLGNYYFMWGGEGNEPGIAICLGFGSVYNHSYNPNATYKKVFAENIIRFITIKEIKKDEEIYVNYNNGNPKDKSKLWIADIPPAE